MTLLLTLTAFFAGSGVIMAAWDWIDYEEFSFLVYLHWINVGVLACVLFALTQ